LDLISPHTAGSPTEEEIKWTYLKPSEIAALYRERYGCSLSNGTVKRILRSQKYVRRKPVKHLKGGTCADRDAQFKALLFLVNLFFQMEHNPVVSIDTKKKELVGQLSRNEAIWCSKTEVVHDHDYPHLAKEKAVPHGIYDLKINQAYVTLGNSVESAKFIVDNLLWWWQDHGKNLYPNATYLLILCDAGGTNSYRHYAFKVELQRLAALIGINIVVSHYPPYCSKYNPIERQLFAPLQRTIKGHLIKSIEYLKERFSIARTKPKDKPPLEVFVRIKRQVYEKGLPNAKDSIDPKRILYHLDMPKYNYTILS
jgi:Rhodopirellula transposase DDE domain